MRFMSSEMKKSHGGYNNIGKAIMHTAIVLYGLSMVFLFYKQTGWSGGAVYESDLPVHIRMIIEDGWYYSLTAFVYQALYQIPFVLPDGAPFGNLAIAVFLGLCGTVSVYLTACLLREAQKTREERSLSAWHLLGGLLLNLVMPCYIRGVADGRYIGMESASIWHNSTYIVMKMAGLFCILYYGKLEKKYRQRISAGEWILFTLLLSLCTAVKPSFLLVFAPVMAIFLLVDLIRRTPFQKVFVFGSTVFAPLLVVWFQNMILFGRETGNGWEIRPGYALSLHSGYPLLSAVLSIFFPLGLLLILLLISRRELLADRQFLGAWLMAAVGFLEVFLFAETGDRAGDGNFMWGYSFAILMIFAVSLAKWAEMGKGILREKRSLGCRLRIGAFVFSALLFLWHIYCGIYFYVHLLQGVSYYMWD